ncbi:MAG: aldo/keto reductase family protein [Gammaproteobacteria bacterium]
MNTVPTFIYGTAWKKEATTNLIKKAVSLGFSAIDTANQPKHYSEAAVGTALLDLQQENIRREHLFLQTKFTPANGQDERIPYDPTLDYATQVQTSFQSSLEHLYTDYVDSYLLHGPYSWPGLGDADWEVWKAIEQIYTLGKARMIGVSNVNIQQLELLCRDAKVKPMVVQNRCFAKHHWDKEVREFCKAHSIIYQGFSLLTANPVVVHSAEVESIAYRLGKTAEQVIFRFCLQIGIVPLTGTSSEAHMQLDLAIKDFELTTHEVATLSNLFY